MGLTVIPPYGVVTTFNRQARKLPAEESVPHLDRSLRKYVRNRISMLHPSILDMGQRSAATQLGAAGSGSADRGDEYT